MGEILPSVGRTLNFRLTSRDFNTAGGAVSCDDVDIIIDASIGPFDVTSQSSATTWTANGSNTTIVTWNVAGTSSLCTNVDILFSTDRGITFPFTIASNVTNNGSHSFTIPSYPTSIGRIKIKCSDNYFFDINLGDITINSTCDAVSTTFSPNTDISAIEGSSGLNLSLSADFGTAVGTINGSVESTDPSSSVAGINGSNTCTNFNGNLTNYDTYEFQTATSGTINFAKASGAFGIVMTIYENNFNPASPCTNFVAGSYNTSTGTISNNVIASLTPGIPYILVVGSFNATLPALPAAYSVTNSGVSIYDGIPSPGSGFSYTYMAVNQATGIIAAVNANSNFTSLAVGTYTVYGISHETTSNINNFVGATFASFQSDASLLVVCAAISINQVSLDIQSSANCPTDYAGANALSGNISGAVDYETNGAIESTQLIQAGATIDYDSGTSIKLEAPFNVPSSATLNAFIDGCGGALQNTEETKDK
jgi:hypothetical protein